MTVWFLKSTLSKSGPHPKQTKMNLSQNENLNRVPIIQNSKKTRKNMTCQQTMLDNFWPLEPRLFFFRLAYSIKYFVRSFISSMELDFRDYHYPDFGVFSILQIFFIANIEFISLSCISGSRWIESFLFYIPLLK